MLNARLQNQYRDVQREREREKEKTRRIDADDVSDLLGNDDVTW
jgi:hypothetical protein